MVAPAVDNATLTFLCAAVVQLEEYTTFCSGPWPEAEIRLQKTHLHSAPRSQKKKKELLVPLA